MKRFQRWFGILLAGSMLLTLAACGQQAQKPAEQNPETQNNAGNTVVSEQESSLKNEGTPSDSQGKKTLVVYYSATGNTEAVAEYVAENLGADIFEITPVDPYTDDDLDYTNEDSRVVYEYENPDARNVELATDSVENWADYDTVLIGYPIWWYIAAWPVDSFVRVNDFTGKTVIPFATSSSSGMGESGELLAKLAGTGDWKEGRRFASRADEAEAQEWLNELGLTAEE